MELLLFDIETDNDSDGFFDRSKYREIYREYINQKQNIKDGRRDEK